MIKQILTKQRRFYKTGITKSYEFRMRTLSKLYETIVKQKESVEAALYNDLGKSKTESYMTEIGIVLQEISHAKKHLRNWMQPRRKLPVLAAMPAETFIQKEPYGVVLIVSPWNYPFQLAMSPLIGAIAAGNCVVIKASEYAPDTSKVIKKIMQEVFLAAHVSAIEGDARTSQAILQERFDYIFFTGSTAVGKIVMEKASCYLTPVTLELGGKSPCIVDETADIQVAAKRILFGKIVNAGQTCVAPDYVLVQKQVKEQLIAAMKHEIYAFLGENPCENKNYPKIITKKHRERLLGLLQNQTVCVGGQYSANGKLAPTIVYDPDVNSPLMQQEIFGPILPVISFAAIEDAIDFVNQREKPLALYIFSNNVKIQEQVMNCCSFGGGCINDTIYHLLSPRTPFGGVGQSGMGQYHGKYSFDTFTHEKTMLRKIGKKELSARYHPYSQWKDWIIHWGLQ